VKKPHVLMDFLMNYFGLGKRDFRRLDEYHEPNQGERRPSMKRMIPEIRFAHKGRMMDRNAARTKRNVHAPDMTIFVSRNRAVGQTSGGVWRRATMMVQGCLINTDNKDTPAIVPKI